MQITHEQARRLIHLDLDWALNPEQSAALFAHLRECRACQLYAEEIKEVEEILSPVMKRQWAIQPVPLSVPLLLGKNKQSSSGTLLTMRTAAMGLVMVALFFSLWQVVSSGSVTASPVPLVVPLVPTPSAQTAHFTSTTQSCEMRLYSVEGDDTLATIAERFSVSQAEILEANHLETAMVQPSMNLLIPVCDSTPTGTVHPATLTTTLTPILGTKSSTPDG